MSDEVQHPRPRSSEDHAGWTAYWAAQGMPWRTEPEIDQERRQFLRECRTIQPDIEKGIYPFRAITLDRADVEWLLATHESGGMRGPVDWSDEKQRGREGLDLRGADLRHAQLNDLPLANTRCGLDLTEWRRVGPELRRRAGAFLEGATLRRTHLEGAHFIPAHLEDAVLFMAHLEGANLRFARLEGADLREAHLEGANLRDAHLEEANLIETHLEGRWLPTIETRHSRRRTHDPSAFLPPADLRGAFFNSATSLNRATLGDAHLGVVAVADVRWGGVLLARVDWKSAHALGDERRARQRRARDGTAKDASARLQEFETAVRANRQLATALQDQGLNEDAHNYAYRAQVLQRQVLRRQGHWARAGGSWLLDTVAGYGYKPIRSVLTYLFVVAGFAAAYVALGGSHSQSLSWNEAVVVSMTAFHGRGFFGGTFQPGDPQAAIAAVEALCGLLIEITFIATFTQRFFAR